MVIHVCDQCDTKIDGDTCAAHPDALISSVWTRMQRSTAPIDVYLSQVDPTRLLILAGERCREFQAFADGWIPLAPWDTMAEGMLEDQQWQWMVIDAAAGETS